MRNYGNNRDRSSSNDISRSGSRASTNRDRIRCYACREYDHFVRDCPNSREESYSICKILKSKTMKELSILLIVQMKIIEVL